MRTSKAIRQCLPCVILRDHREKEESNKWDFGPSAYCSHTEDCYLETGDYTIKGFEKYLSIERKASVNDFVCSMAKKRFKDELWRLSHFPHPFVILEFGMEDLVNWPESSGCNPYIQKKLPLRIPGAALSAYLNLSLSYPQVPFIFTGSAGKKLTVNIFKRIIEAYAKEIVNEQAIIERGDGTINSS